MTNFYLIIFMLFFKCLICSDLIDKNNNAETKIDHKTLLEDAERNITIFKLKIGRLYSENSALLHKMHKIDEYIKRGTDMETRFVLEFFGYPFLNKIPPEEFLGYLSTALNISYNVNHVRGIRVACGLKYSPHKIMAEMATAKIKKQWLKAYKQKLYEISLGKEGEKKFGDKKPYKFFEHKAVYVQDFLPTLCEIHNVPPTIFAINDYISPYRKRLLAYAKLLASHYQWRFVWVSDGDILVRRTDGEPGVYIRSERDFRAFDWRLENEQFFWKTLNSCNLKRRDALKRTSKRVLPWMNTRRPGGVPKYQITFDENLQVFKRKHEIEMKHLLAEYSTVNEYYDLETLTQTPACYVSRMKAYEYVANYNNYNKK